MTGLSETHAEHLKNSIDKLSKLATSISDKTREVLQEEINRKVNVDVANLVRRVVEAKTHEWTGLARIKATINLVEVSCFIDPLELDRALCNLIDNAAESSPRGASIEIALSKTEKAIAIRIIDQGCGIAPEHLQKLGTKGFTFGKNNGSGLGVYYAKKAAEDAGGTFKVSSSVGHGTTVELTLPAIVDTETSLPNFRSGTIDTVVFVDDSEFVHEIADSFLVTLAGGAAKSMTVLSFRRPEEFRAWLANSSKSQKHFAFVDYRFENLEENGLDLIEQSRLQSRSALLTAFPDDSRIVSRAKALGVPVLFKEFIFSGPVGFI